MNKLSPVLWLDEPKPEESLKNYVLERYHGYLDVFTKKEAIPLPLHRPWDHIVTLISNASPPFSAESTLCPAERKNSKRSTLRNRKMPALSENRHPHTWHLFSISERRTGVTALYLIIRKSMLSWSRMSFSSLELTPLSKECVEWYSSVNLIFAMAIGTSKTVMKWRTL